MARGIISGMCWHNVIGNSLTYVLLALIFNISHAAKLSNSKLLPTDGTMCGQTKMGFKFSKSELIDRFKALSDNTKDPVEVVQIYVTGQKLDAICLYDPVMVEERKSINAAITEFEDGERGINISASPEVISLGSWLPYFVRDKAEACVTSVKADTMVYFQSEINIEVIAPLSQAGAKLRLNLHCEMPGPQTIKTDLKVHRVDHIGSAVGEIPFSELIQMKFVNPSDPTMALTEVSLDEPVRLVLWKVRQEDRSTLRTSVIPMHCELQGDHDKAVRVTFVQNSCQVKTPAEIITNVMTKKTDVDGMEFREVFWTDFKAFRFDGSTGLVASCTIRVCSKTHLADCQNRMGHNGLPCFDEGSIQEMSEYPSITGESADLPAVEGRAIEQPNPELELFRLAYPRKIIPAPPQRSRRSAFGGESGEYVTIKQRLNVVPHTSVASQTQSKALEISEANLLHQPTGTAFLHSDSAIRKPDYMCFQSFVIYTVAGITSWIFIFVCIVIIALIRYIRKQRKSDTFSDKECQRSVSSIDTAVSFADRQPIRFR
ncbi:uncharacterized protein LOC129585709 [Paramacrobiotus metropolitanus]|uniref:uncharacterized protein LOC129585709 n=1 Tax=Paramacrobiotus metropolitanus TaxID=2943436 RepID=UPI00244637FE|nr:uncharacterized protein LOC129585709 [Paramacrobiotus metropolitanus]